MKSLLHATGGLVIPLLSACRALACPFCESETGQQVRAGIFNDQFWANVVLTLLPFPILLTIVALIYFDVRWQWGCAERRTAESARSNALLEDDP